MFTSLPIILQGNCGGGTKRDGKESFMIEDASIAGWLHSSRNLQTYLRKILDTRGGGLQIHGGNAALYIWGRRHGILPLLERWRAFYIRSMGIESIA